MAKPNERPLILPPSGGYEKLVSFQVAKLLYAVTVRFVDRYIPAGSRTADHPFAPLRRNRQRAVASATLAKEARSAPPPRSWS